MDYKCVWFESINITCYSLKYNKVHHNQSAFNDTLTCIHSVNSSVAGYFIGSGNNLNFLSTLNCSPVK